MRMPRLSRERALIVLDVVKFLLLLVLAVAFINFNTKLSQEVKATQQIAQNQEKTLHAQKEAVQTLTTTSNTKFDNLQNHIDCIVALFQQPNRTNLIISDLRNCKISSSSIPTAAVFKQTTSQQVAQTPKATSAPKKSSTTTPAPTRSPQPAAAKQDTTSPLSRLLQFLGL